MKKYIVYGRSTCPYCVKVVNKLIRKGKSEGVKEIIITEKDFYRLSKDNLNLIKSHFKLLYTQIEFDFIKEEKLLFNKQILKFI